MAFKPNYNQQRNERARLKRAKKAEKLRQKQERAERRKDAPQGTETPDDENNDLPE